MSKIWYRVAPGVAWVNGVPVPASGRVLLGETEAAFDIGLGRIAPDVVAVDPAPLPAPDDPVKTRPARRGKAAS